ncbi:TIGR03618 family F420-dependent PPOX class oxidoreductase [Gordonia amarae]|uniref:Pyridoxamine 5'-phosphate oxidase N-terminal domain-containing protein n=2 Tax=Gordonia amarae TaxID=36821 RepID=G7GL96_9ACTN|nr:PPOX class F420-dependent oxidoreductase [Gordonia amarae]MCS3878897.1 PPOX class probable F420-dependent enzyme [Gordonia amarae]QHN17456.1 TIGR03618 family F420-dependent PPOX class oxidoreductase [Gordonia amarae]QHN21982.1 TIGR03618 family F420-dependent PPOX class oxidoreductase [Gordonia amarae]QHN30862.1 TIGR03618 family F420-dependent PPOX class oxidoreductase [Gordonia amarae]QHN39608.1 TIGR03618 family F420-dependent PPOX class oxidoreductase [Gordonia amarae]
MANQRAQVVMTDDEIKQFLQDGRTATLATNGPNGFPHQVAMWYGFVDGQLCFETKIKSQKAVNLLRDPKLSISVEAGESYDQLRGVAIDGTARIVYPDGPEYWPAAISVFERYQAPYTEEMKPAVEFMMTKRVVVVVEPHRIRSWDHRKLT